MVLACAEILRAQGKNPHVISRGYKGRYSGTVRVDAAHHSAQEVGDEPLLIARHVPCWVSAKRIDAACAAMADGADVILMDDGMQNPTLHKDMSIMVVDGGYGFGNRKMLPAGPCREPLSVSLLKAQALVVMGDATHTDAQLLLQDHNAAFNAQMVAQTALPEGPLLAFAGIGRPQKFFDMLRAMGAPLSDTVSFPDHHIFSEKELQNLAQNAAQHKATLLTTEKDWLRLSDAWRERINYVEVKAEITPKAAFETLLKAATEPKP
jgi:tetraacyldisaccharide 4'-kinase